MNKQFGWFVLGALLASVGIADPKSVRWTGKDDANAELGHVLSVIEAKTGIKLAPSDLLPIEDRDLAHNHFTMWFEASDGTPVKGQVLRVWKRLDTGAAVQVEATVDKPPARHWGPTPSLSSEETMRVVRQAIRNQGEDMQLQSLDWRDYIDHGRFVRVVRAKAKHGEHDVTISLDNGQLLEAKYKEYPQADASEFSIPVEIFPIYEQVANTDHMLPRVNSELRYLKANIPDTYADPYDVLRKGKRYLMSKYDPILGATEQGRAKGYWSTPFLKLEALDILNKLPMRPNDFVPGVRLEGRYATVNFYPDVATKLKGLDFQPTLSPILKGDFKPATDVHDDEYIPQASLYGKPILSPADAASRPARKLADNDPSTLANDGFDELQVYWAVTQLFDSLRPMGFTDPELSTRPFNAFLYDTDIEYRDNAFYTDDTINFTTYSKENMARDNSTIWHELGHGVMDRLMGDYITLADTGGLSEGMADFVAQMVLNDVTNLQPYEGQKDERIFNRTGFYLTNEVHDDGESYGGTMNDLLQAAIRRDGRAGLTKVVDLTLETMRLTRNHPGLTANDWFGHMLFADELGNTPARAPGELHGLIVEALAGRNFNLDASPVAKMTVMVADQELTSSGPGSRDNPIKLKLKASESTSYDLSVKLTNSANYQFKFPVTVRVSYVGGPLQGAIHWAGKEHGSDTYTLRSAADTVPFKVAASGKCDEINRPDGSCSDFAYIQIWNDGEKDRPQAKKRFYLRIYPQ